LPASEDTRVIRIPLSKLRTGDLRFNIPIRPRDTIFVPAGLVGVYFMQGHVARPGSYRFEGQKITLTQAVTSASGLDGLAVPQRTEIIRRIGPNQEMFYRVDLAAIAAGRRPNIYLQPNDTVSVGTNFLAPFLAAVRGGFRLTYGFGFLYDRNFAYDEDSQSR
jgi:protein involved in polysaccharide export with SLBB domain